MLNDHRAGTRHEQEDDDHGDDEIIRDIHAMTPPHPPQAANRGRQREAAWETGSHRSSPLSMASTEGASSENFTTLSREFSALVVAGSTIANSSYSNNDMNDSTVNSSGNNNLGLGRIREELDMPEETNPLAIVPDNYHSLDPIASPRSTGANNNNMAGSSSSSLISTNQGSQGEISVHRVKKEEVESKISAWQNAKIAKLNNRFKREDAIINGWENEQVQKASSWMKKVERKLEEKRARALEKMQNDIAKAHRKAEERKASAEAKRGTKVARVLEIANLMRAVGRAPAKKSFF